LAFSSSIASIVAFFIDVSAIDRSPESENSTPTLIASLLAAPWPAVVLDEVLPLEPQAVRKVPRLEAPSAAPPASLITSRRVDC
jgi:hypothetical protein